MKKPNSVSFSVLKCANHYLGPQNVAHRTSERGPHASSSIPSDPYGMRGSETWALTTASQEERQEAERDEGEGPHSLGNGIVDEPLRRAWAYVVHSEGDRRDAHRVGQDGDRDRRGHQDELARQTPQGQVGECDGQHHERRQKPEPIADR